MTDLTPPHATIATSEILNELDRAIMDHLEWLKNWHRALVCGEPADVRDMAYDAHHLGRFGSWYVKNQHKGLVNQPAVKHLAELHQDLHNRARALLEHARGGPLAEADNDNLKNQSRALPRDQYEAFMDASNSFIAQARRLGKAFAQASATIDPLTGLHNRQSMMDDLERARALHLRTGDPCTFVLADIDHFKSVNDTHGHAAGDRVLSATAACFLSHMRPYDSVYRYGGEEFLFCLPGARAEDAMPIMDRLRQALSETAIDIGTGEPLCVTSSFGIAELGENTPIDVVCKRADEALYAAKKGGRNQVVKWLSEMAS